jgi:hypothetical protein
MTSSAGREPAHDRASPLARGKGEAMSPRRIGLWAALLPFAPALLAAAEPMQAPAPHRHAAIDLDLPPIVSRLRLPVSQPRRAIYSPDGALYVADWAAGTVCRLAPDGHVETLARGLFEPAGLACDASGDLFVAAHAGGVPELGSVLRIRADGVTDVVAEQLTGPTALAATSDGRLFVASFRAGTITRLDPDGASAIVAAGLAGPSALALDREGRLYCACSTDGTVLRLGENGPPETLARGLASPSDLAFDAEHRLVAVCYASGELMYVTSDRTHRPYAVVPAGTISVAFAADGNFALVNWDDASAVRVVTTSAILCPHCGASIPLRLRQAPVLPTTPFGDDGPVI